ncbi:MAG: hypothetical protein JWO82_2543 [Akkermansiaceae bacterium]|nr:hypothetical protein [Akkermansiaceae bacterium]
MFGNLKDSLASTAAKKLLEGKIERYGRIVELRLRSKAKMIYLEVMLTGEASPVCVDIGKYRVTAGGPDGKYLLIIEEVTASREWLQMALRDFLVGQPIPVPGMALIALGGVDGDAGA